MIDQPNVSEGTPRSALPEASPEETPAAAPHELEAPAEATATAAPSGAVAAALEAAGEAPPLESAGEAPELAPAEPVPAESLAGESLAGEPVAGESVAGESLAGESLAGEAIAAEPAPAQAEPPAAAGGETTVAPADGKPAPRKPSPEELEARRARAQAAWDRVVAAREQGEVLTGSVTAVVKGGLLVDVGGIRGFLPASQVRPPGDAPLESLLRAKLPLKVLDIDESRRRIVVSARRAAEAERRAKRTELMKTLAVGQMREVVVVRLADFGAFVDLGGIDGLIPMRELAFERVDKAGDIVTVGEKLTVEVIRIEEGGKKIALSRKNALPDPWRDHAALLRTGATVQGKVVAKEPRLEVELAPGVVGSVRESDADPNDYELGEAIEVSIRFVDRRTRRIGLTTLHEFAATITTTTGGFAPLGVELGRR
jgi:predicted RNA-binding protein with RPS1 domain